MTYATNGTKTYVSELTLPDSGVVLKIKHLGPMLLRDVQKRVRRQYPKPSIPLSKVIIDDRESMQPNEADPNYQEALAEYGAEFGLRMVEGLVRYGVDCEVDAAAVQALRSELGDVELPDNDLVLYVTRIAVTSQADLMALQEALVGQVQPTAPAVAEAAETFRG